MEQSSSANSTLNFRAYDVQLPFGSVMQEVRRYCMQNIGASVIIGLVVLAVAVGLLTLVLTQGVDKSEQWLFYYVAPIGLVVGVGLMFMALFFHAKQRLRLSMFAKDNQFEYTAKISDPGEPGIIFDEGHSRQAINVLTGSSHGSDFSIFNYQYVTGSGKSRQTHVYGVIKMSLSRRLPHVLLDAKSNNLFGKISNLPASFGGNQSLRLEGNFNTYFDVHVPDGYGQDTLYFLTPELMALLIDHGRKFDIEVVDDVLYLYSSSALRLNTSDSVKAVFDVMQRLWTEFEENTTRYRDERIGDKMANLIAPEGRRLKKGISWVAYILIAAYIIGFMLELLFD